MNYAPSPAPLNSGPLGAYVRAELERLAGAIKEPKVLQLSVSYVEPDKPRQGWLVYADGTSFDPGSGEGLYRHDGAAWVFIG